MIRAERKRQRDKMDQGLSETFKFLKMTPDDQVYPHCHTSEWHFMSTFTRK